MSRKKHPLIEFSNGDGATVSGGDGATVSGGSRATVSGGDGATVSGGWGSALVLTGWDRTNRRYRKFVAVVGIDGVKPDTAYRFNECTQKIEEVEAVEP